MRLITDILREYRRGRVVDQASRMLNEIVRAVDDTNKPGEVTIKIKIKPSKDRSAEKGLAATVSCKRPEPDIPDAIFFSTPEGDLVRSDPAQKEMPFQAVDDEPEGKFSDRQHETA